MGRFSTRRSNMSTVKRSSSNKKLGRDEKAIVKDIAKQFVLRDQNRLEIGRLVNELVELNHGVKYGDSTIERIAQNRDIQRSSRQIRRYWDLYRLHQLYGSELNALGSALSPSYWYELARFLNVDGLTIAKTKALILEYATNMKAKRDAKLPITVDTFTRMIDAAIAALKNGAGTPKPIDEPKGNHPTPKPSSTPIAIIDGEKNGAESTTINVPVTAVSLQRSVETIQDEWFESMDRLVAMEEWSAISPLLKSMQKRMDQIRKRMSIF